MADKSESFAVKAAMKTPPRWMIPWISRTHVALYTLTAGRIGANLAGVPYIPDAGDRILVASYGGGPTNPAWYYNLKANPAVVIRDRGAVVWCEASVVTGDDYAALWPKVVADSPWYGEYEKRTTRTIPLIRLRETGPYTG
jgi:deazaflavin-dependent oxidoreductase (nitroreductase family)